MRLHGPDELHQSLGGHDAVCVEHNEEVVATSVRTHPIRYVAGLLADIAGSIAIGERGPSSDLAGQFPEGVALCRAVLVSLAIADHKERESLERAFAVEIT